MAKRNLPHKLNCKRARQKRESKREERRAKMAKATRARLAKKTAPPPNPNAETPQQDEAGPSTSAAPTEEAMEPPPPTPGPVPTPDMDEEILEFGDSLPSTSATPIGDLVPFPSTPIAPMDTGEMTPPPLIIDERSVRIEQLEKELKDRDDTIAFLREQVRNRQSLITDLRRQLDEQMAPPMAPPTSEHFFQKRQRPICCFTILFLLRANTTFWGFWMSRVGDEALHSVWRRLEQLWKTMPDAEQMRQQLEHHFVSNWLMDTGRLDELNLREEERREQAAEDKTNEESDQDADIDVVD
ncbi:hypothetical protein niasHT_034611 [Heterodera trifolii]|uniref:Uncharacterized protein n=1 Tax=Heterodera trifolii TaxID=157864 RepID=A0ABD2IKW4_9BILA